MTSRGQQLLIPGKGQSGLPVKSGLVAWYNADKITGVVNGGAVSSWVDSSGQNRDLSQSTQSQRPTLLLPDADFNGRASVVFDGVNDVMSAVATLTAAQPVTIFSVVKITASAQQMIQDTAQASPNRLILFQSATAPVTVAVNAANSVTQTFTINTPSVLEGIINGNASQMFVNGSGGTVANAGTQTLSAANLRIGSDNVGARSLTGKIASHLFYARLLSVSERSLVRQYLGTYYGITVTP